MGDVHNHYAPAVSSTNGVAIEWRDTGYDVGIDNIDFTAAAVSSAVPEPSTLILLGLGRAACAGVRRRRRLR